MYLQGTKYLPELLLFVVALQSTFDATGIVTILFSYLWCYPCMGRDKDVQPKTILSDVTRAPPLPDPCPCLHYDVLEALYGISVLTEGVCARVHMLDYWGYSSYFRPPDNGFRIQSWMMIRISRVRIFVHHHFSVQGVCTMRLAETKGRVWDARMKTTTL